MAALLDGKSAAFFETPSCSWYKYPFGSLTPVCPNDVDDDQQLLTSFQIGQQALIYLEVIAKTGKIDPVAIQNAYYEHYKEGTLMSHRRKHIIQTDECRPFDFKTIERVLLDHAAVRRGVRRQEQGLPRRNDQGLHGKHGCGQDVC